MVAIRAEMWYSIPRGNHLMPALAKEQTYYTFADVLEWADDVRAEIIGGELYMMATPERVHQAISRDLLIPLGVFLKGKPCEVYSAPFCVRPFARDDFSDNTYVEPDIAVICDLSKLDKWGCRGAPDFIIEIVSPSTARVDREVKLELYQRIGVREYWIVDPERRQVSVHILASGRYTAAAYGENDTLAVSVLPGCAIPLRDVFPPVTA
jgi:Uma2 family endonuclease